MDRYREGVRARRQEGEPMETFCPKCDPGRLRPIKVDDHSRGAKERDGARVNPRPLMRRYIEKHGCSACMLAGWDRTLPEAPEAQRMGTGL